MQVKYIYAEKVLVSLNFTASQTVANKMHLYRCRAHSEGPAGGLASLRRRTGAEATCDSELRVPGFRGGRRGGDK